MTFRCTKKCLIQVREGDELVVNLVGEEGEEYEDTFDYTQHSKHFVRVDGPAKVKAVENEFPEPGTPVSYADTNRDMLVSIALERGIEGAEKMNRKTLAKRLRTAVPV